MSERNLVVDRERDFHNARFAQEVDPRAPLDKWYRTIRHGAQLQNRRVLAAAAVCDVLEYGCAEGGLSLSGLKLPEVACSLVGIDISDVAIETATQHALEAGYGNARFIAMDAEAMTFEARSFDLVFGRGIIHHLDLDRCYAEIARVLRPGGQAIFYEPLGHNALINAYRNATPDLRTPDEHPIVMPDIALARSYFRNVDVEYFGLASVGSAMMPSVLREPAYQIGKALDAVLLRVPGIGRFAWYALMTLRA